MKAPDLIEPFVGWKGLLADPAGSLFSPAVPTAWPARKKLVAECTTHEGHKPPVKSCGCGIYAVKTFDDLRDNHYNVDGQALWSFVENEMTWVIARVALWGDVAEGRIGYRAQYAYPKKIYVPADKLKLAALIRERYGVKVGIIDRYTGKGAA